MRSRSNDPRTLLTCALAGGCTAVLRVTPVFDPDYFWHLHTGRWIAAHGVVPAVDSFSHTFAGRPWKFVDWLADLAMYGAWRAGGDRAVVVAFAVIGGVAVALALHHAARAVFDGRVCVAGIAGVAALLVAAVVFRVTPRPQTFTFLLFAIEVACLERARSDARWGWSVPPLLALWQNLHSSAILGWGALVAFTVGVSLEGRLRAPTQAYAADADVRHDPPSCAVSTAWTLRWATVAAGAAALFVSVRPVQRLLAGFDHLDDRRVADLFVEWRPVWRVGEWSSAAIAFLVLAALAASLFLVRKPPVPPLDASRAEPIDRWLVALAMTTVAARTLRFVPLAAIALAPLALRALNEHLAVLRGLPKGRIIRRLVAAAVVGVGGFLTWRERKPLGFGVDPALFPEGAARFVERTHPRGRLYNDFHFGGYLMWVLGDAHPVFIDGRSMALYGVDFVIGTALADDLALDRLLTRWDIGLAIAPTGKRLGWFQHHPGWSLVWFDDVAFVAVRDADNERLVTERAYRAIHPATYWEDVARLSRDAGARPAAHAEAQRALAEAPHSSIAHVAMAAVAMGSDEGELADREIESAIRVDPTAVRGHRVRAMRCVERDDVGCACAESATVLRLAPTNEYARALRAQLGCPPYI